MANFAAEFFGKSSFFQLLTADFGVAVKAEVFGA